MRVHHIINNYSNFTGGAPRVVRALHEGLRRRDVQSFVLGLTRQEDPHLDGARSLGLHSPYALAAFRGIAGYVRADVQAGDIIHVHLFPPLLYLSLLKLLRQARGRLVCTEHSTSNRRRAGVLGRALDTVTYAGYERVVAISPGVEQELLKWKPSLKGKTTIIPNGVHLAFDRIIRRNGRRPLKIVSVGNLRPAKNYDGALRAVALLEDGEFEYHIAGSGESRQALHNLSHELGLQDRVRFLGYVNSVPELLAAADVFLMPSRWEGFGIAAVEAMNAALPLIVGDVPGLREIVGGEAPCALLVDPQSPRAIAAAVSQLLRSPDLRRRLGANAFHRAHTYSLERMVDGYLSLYHELI